MGAGWAVASRALVGCAIAGSIATGFACGSSARVDAPVDRRSASARSTPTDLTLGGATATIALAESTYYRSQFDSARVLLESALAAADAQADSATRARALAWLGYVAYAQADYSTAVTFGEQALALAARLHLTTELLLSYNVLGLSAYYQGRYEDALSLLTSELDRARAIHDSTGVAKALANLGLVWVDVGAFARARTTFEQARDAMFASGNKRGGANALTNLGMLNIRVGDPPEALRVLATARAIYDTIGFARGQEAALGQMAEAYDAAGDPKLAFAYTDSALAIARQYRLREQQVDGLRHKASLYSDAGDFERSLDYFEQARVLATELGLQEVVGEISREEARVLAGLGTLDRAEVRAREALAVHRAAGTGFEQLADLLLVAELADRGGRPSQAADALREAEHQSDLFSVGVARVMFALTKARMADRHGSSGATLRALAAIDADLRRVGPGLTAEAFALRARAFTRLGRLREAADAGRRSVAALELVRTRFGASPLGTTFTASRARVYGDLVLVLLRLDRVDEALEIADRARGRALLEYMTTLRPSPRKDDGRAELARAEELLDRIDKLVERLARADSIARPERGAADPATASPTVLAELTAARREYEELLMRAAESNRRTAGLIGAARLSASGVRQALAPDEAVLEYLVTPERLVTFVVRQHSVAVFDTAATPQAIDARVRLARDLLTRRLGRSDAPVLGVLHDLLVAPATRRGLLDGVQTLVVVPHGALTYLPFSALRDTASGRFLVERYDVLMLPSAASLVALRSAAREASNTRPPNASGAAVLAPTPEALPGSRDEAREVGRVLGERPLLGLNASERALREALLTRAIVHVATHAALNARSPMFSRLELAGTTPTPRDDGRLELHELLSERIASRLVFLSGCETALGTAQSTVFQRGEDYTTLAQAFLQAGASNVVATLWRIEDRGAAEFASAFYRALRDRPPAAALASAQRAMLEGRAYAAPYYWAAYQIEGAGDVIPTSANSLNVVR